MVLKGLAIGAAMATVVVAFVVALSFQPTGALVSAPEGTMLVLPNGLAAPQLKPAQPGAPALVEAEARLGSLARPSFDRLAGAALDQRANLSAPARDTSVGPISMSGCGN